jgi:hypothetical protein
VLQQRARLRVGQPAGQAGDALVEQRGVHPLSPGDMLLGQVPVSCSSTCRSQTCPGGIHDTGTRPSATACEGDGNRPCRSSPNTLTGLASDIAALRTALDAIATRVRSHEEQLRKLTRQERRPAAGQ